MYPKSRINKKYFPVHTVLIKGTFYIFLYMDYPKNPSKAKKIPIIFFIKSFFYIEGENSDFAQGKIVQKKNEAGCKSKKKSSKFV